MDRPNRPATSTPTPAAERGWSGWLGMNSSTLALLGAILLVTAATELWAPLMPKYLKDLGARYHGGEVGVILIIGLYGLYRDGLEAINYLLGGVISGRFNTRRALLLFNVLPLVGLALLICWQSRAAVFAAIPFVFVWDSIAGPATITVVGDAVPPERRTMAFSLQAIFRRVARMVAYAISGVLVWWLGEINGVRADAIAAVLLIGGAALVQLRYQRTASRDESMMIARPRELLSRFSPDLRRLLIADIAARWAEGLAIQYVILYCVPIISADARAGTAFYQSVLLNIQAATNIALYVLIGPLASRTGLAKKPYIGLTFVFFALFPIALSVLGASFGFVGLMLAFVIGGMREIGEPARKAMIAELVPAEAKSQAVGLYWGVRSLAVMAASPIGALLWIVADRWQPGAGPHAVFASAGIVGIIGAGLFFRRFGRAAATANSSAPTG